MKSSLNIANDHAEALSDRFGCRIDYAFEGRDGFIYYTLDWAGTQYSWESPEVLAFIDEMDSRDLTWN